MTIILLLMKQKIQIERKRERGKKEGNKGGKKEGREGEIYGVFASPFPVSIFCLPLTTVSEKGTRIYYSKLQTIK